MEHPFINNIDSLSLEELQNKLSELNKKITFAYRTNNGPLIHQLSMAIESYRNAYSKKMDDLIKKQNISTQIKIENNK